MNDALCWTTRMSTATLEDGERLSGSRGEHAATCLRCQAEAVRYRRLRRGLSDLGRHLATAPNGLVLSMLDAVDQDQERSPGSSRIVGVAAAGAAAVVAAGTVAVLRRIRGAA